MKNKVRCNNCVYYKPWCDSCGERHALMDYDMLNPLSEFAKVRNANGDCGDFEPIFKPGTINLKVLTGPAWSKDPIENRMMNDMVNGR